MSRSAVPARVKMEQPSAYVRNPAVPDRALVERRRADALSLKQQGFSNLQIGRKLHADPDWVENSDRWPDGYPGGYGWRNYRQGRDPLLGHALENAVSLDISQQVRHARLARESMRQEAVQLKLMTLEAAAAAIYPHVMRGDARSHEVWLQNQKLQIDLQGLNPAEQVEHTVTVTGQVEMQPVWNGDYAGKFWSALAELDAVPADSAPPDFIDVEGVEVPAEEITDATIVE